MSSLMPPQPMDPQTAALMQQGGGVGPLPVDPQTQAAMQQGAPVGPSVPGVPGQLDPALIKQMLLLNAQGPKAEQAKRQLALADKLRADATGMGKSQSPINTPNWAGTLAGVLSNYAAGKMDKEAQATNAGLAQERMDRYGDFFQGLGN